MKYKDQLYIDWETADRITVNNLKDSYAIMRIQLDNPATHPEDREYNIKMMKSIEELLSYYGAGL